MEEERPTYHIYLLTVWQEPPLDSVLHWRYRLVDPQTGLDCGFITPDALPHALQFLRTTVAVQEEPQ